MTLKDKLIQKSFSFHLFSIIIGFVQAQQSKFFPPLIQITSFVVSLIILTIFLTICIICRIKAIRKSKNKQIQNLMDHKFIISIHRRIQWII